MNNLEKLYLKYREVKDKSDYYSSELQKFPKTDNGYYPEKVRASKEFKEIDRKFKKYFRMEQDFNKTLTNKQKRELRKYIKSL